MLVRVARQNSKKTGKDNSWWSNKNSLRIYYRQLSIKISAQISTEVTSFDWYLFFLVGYFLQTNDEYKLMKQVLRFFYLKKLYSVSPHFFFLKATYITFSSNKWFKFHILCYKNIVFSIILKLAITNQN